MLVLPSLGSDWTRALAARLSMSLVSTFVDAFKKAAGKQPKKPDIDEVRSSGGLGSTHSAEPFTRSGRRRSPIPGRGSTEATSP